MKRHRQIAAHSKPSLNEQSSAARPRPPSITYIPRPVSGTSRQASSTLTVLPEQQRVPNSESERLSSSCYEYNSSQPQHRSFCPNNGMPPTSFPRPRTPLSLPTPQPLWTNQPRRRSLIKGHSKCTSEFPKSDSNASKNNTRPSIGLPTPSQQKLPILSRVLSHEIIPRALMRPIQPSLPKSQTTSSLACLIGDHVASPSKPPRRSCLEDRFSDEGTPQPNAVDALMTSEQSKHVSNLRNSTCDKMDANHEDLSSGQCVSTAARSVLPHYVSNVSSAGNAIGTTSSTAVTVNLSINDEVNARKLAEQRRESNSRKPLLINTTLANTARTHGSPPLSYSTPCSGETCLINRSEASPQRRNVYRAEPPAFWSGRYIATADRIRNADCHSLLRPGLNGTKPLNINSIEFEQQFDKLDASRTTRALDEIRQHCKTQAAIKSFDRFETQFQKSLQNLQPNFVRSYSEVFHRKKKTSHGELLKQPEVTGIRQYSGNNATSQLSTFNAQATIDKITSLVGRSPGLIRSRTTGNLTSRAVSERAHTPGALRVPGRRADVVLSPQIRAKPHGYSIFEARAQAMGEFNTRPRVLLNNLECLKGSNDLLSEECVDQWPLRPQFPATDSRQVTGDKLTVSVRAPTAPRDTIAPTTIRSTASDVVTEGTIGETVLYSKKRQDWRGGGQRSGEIVKKMVGASIREVRKLSWRVGSIGWGSNHDDAHPNTQPQIR